MEYRYGSHTVYKIQYHFVFVTKYRYQELKGEVGLEISKSIRIHAERLGCDLVELNVQADHVHRVSRSGGRNELTTD